MIRIAIDGPSGAGKSTMAKLLATDLGIDYIDTGAMYRALALKLFRTKTNPDDSKALSELLASTDVDYESGKVFLDGEDVSSLIRTPEVSEMASVSSAVPAVREKLVALQKAMGERKSLVMDGRDIGTNVLKDTAEYKFYLDASAFVRAGRRAVDMRIQGLEPDEEALRKEIEERDYRDSHRAVNPLMQAEDAIYIDSSDLSIEDVINLMKSYIK